MERDIDMLTTQTDEPPRREVIGQLLLRNEAPAEPGQDGADERIGAGNLVHDAPDVAVPT